MIKNSTIYNFNLTMKENNAIDTVSLIIVNSSCKWCLIKLLAFLAIF